MRFGSLFSGIGGFDLGFERNGLESAWQVEIDKDCKRVLTRHWPNVERFDDVSTVTNLPAVDVLCGGFPCQDLSVAGKRAGLAGGRSGLWFEFLRIAQVNKPGTIVIENVPGLLSSDEHRDFAIILRGLVECGYCLAWRVLDAQFYGVAQRRRRVFIVGSLGNGRCAQILFESESVSWNPPARREARQGTPEVSVRRAQTSSNGWGVRTDGSTGTLDGTGGDAVISGAVSSKWAKGTVGPAGDEAYNLVTHALRSEGADASEDGTGTGTPMVLAEVTPEEFGGRNSKGYLDRQKSRSIATLPETLWPAEVSPPLDGSWADRMPGSTNQEWISQKGGRFVPAPIAGEIAPTMRSQNFKDSHMNGGGQVAIAFQSRVARNGRGAPSDIVSPLKAESKGGDAAPLTAGNFGVRRLTPRECERLQSFPDDFTRWDSDGKEISDSARYRMLGNAICVNVAQWIGKRILEIA